MKVTKIKKIKNLAVFEDYNWDEHVKDKNGSVQNFKDINIIYGRNYSGKTTLSRIFRAFETGTFSDKYQAPEYELEFQDGSVIRETDIGQKKNFRVFNSDFIKENLTFIYNEDGKVQPFAILGSDNTRLEQEINSLREELGKNTDEKKTGLYKKCEEMKNSYDDDKKNLDNKITSLDTDLSNKAAKMKNENRLFVDATYNKISLKKDINKILKESSIIESGQELSELYKLLKEDIKVNVAEIQYSDDSDEIKNRVMRLLNRTVESADKIKELVENNLLNNWVKTGLPLHNDRTTCAFCGQPLLKDRIISLQNHFNQEMDSFQKDLDQEIGKINEEKKRVENLGNNLRETLFYVTFQAKAKEQIEKIKSYTQDYHNVLTTLCEQIQNKKNNVFHPVEFSEPNYTPDNLIKAVKCYNKLVHESNSFGKELNSEQKKAQDILRLDIVKKYIDDSRYLERKEEIDDLENKVKLKKYQLDEMSNKVLEKERNIEEKKSQLNDEEKGAKKVNQYLSHFFGHEFIELVAKADEYENEKHFIFEIQRNGEKAYNLSEGECRLIAFAYFVAKLNDVTTVNARPIIWIDDPICSLDANHIFFIYSLISSEIVLSDNWCQLFITTHNLDFLKYLKRLKCKFAGKTDEKQKAYFLIVRKEKVSELKMMPKYMKDYVTEFNYLFNAIYECANSDLVDDNYSIFYNFCNNARKFLEIFLFYKFPDDTEERKKQENFFGEKLPVFLTERITNEYSHLQGDIERASIPIEYPIEEMKKDAKKILECIKIHDEEQYTALLRSIGIQES